MQIKNNTLNISTSLISEILLKSSILIIFLSFYFYLLAEVFFEVTNFRILTLVVGYAFFALSILIYPKIKINTQWFLYLSSSLLLYLITSLFWLVKQDINIYLSAITALIIISNYNYFLKVMSWFIVLTFLLAAFEFFTKEYLFVVFRDTLFGYRPLDEHFFGGYAKIFRAKVYFEGPLALSQFAIGSALLFRKNLKILILILLIAVFANGRLGIVICGFILAMYFFKKYNLISIIKKPKVLAILLVVLVFVILLLPNFIDQASLDRLKEAFNTSNQGNSDRIQYWVNAFNMLFDTDFIHFVFGNNGYYESVYNNSTENGWLSLLVNNGLIGFLYYFIPVVLIIINSINNNKINLIYMIVLLFCMFVQTFHLGASANLFYWLIIYSFLYEKHIENSNK